MALKKKTAEVASPTIVKAGTRGFIALRRKEVGRYPYKRTGGWQIVGNDIHSSAATARSCCGGTGPGYGVLEVTLVSIYESKLSQVKLDKIDFKLAK